MGDSDRIRVIDRKSRSVQQRVQLERHIQRFLIGPHGTYEKMG